MERITWLFKSKKQALAILILLILLIAIPLTMYLVRRQQILKGRATGVPPIEFFNASGADLGTNTSGIAVATEPNVRLKLTFITPAPTTAVPTSTPAPTATPTPSPSPTPTPTPAGPALTLSVYSTFCEPNGQRGNVTFVWSNIPAPPPSSLTIKRNSTVLTSNLSVSAPSYTDYSINNATTYQYTISGNWPGGAGAESSPQTVRLVCPTPGP